MLIKASNDEIFFAGIGKKAAVRRASKHAAGAKRKTGFERWRRGGTGKAGDIRMNINDDPIFISGGEAFSYRKNNSIVMICENEWRYMLCRNMTSISPRNSRCEVRNERIYGKGDHAGAPEAGRRRGPCHCERDSPETGEDAVFLVVVSQDIGGLGLGISSMASALGSEEIGKGDGGIAVSAGCSLLPFMSPIWANNRTHTGEVREPDVRDMS
jgi:hypothetical protein